MVSIDYLVTTVKKSRDEILDIIHSLNVNGNIIVGNQGCETNEIIKMVDENCKITILNQVGFGVSKNRNAILSYSKADYVSFLDDDMYFEKERQNQVEKLLEQNQYDGVRFNVVSDNIDRPIKQLGKKGYVGFRSLSSYGVWGIFFKRDFLVKNKILFNENIGPGTEINHGEDGLFNKTFTKHSKIFSIPCVAFHVKQTESTWHDTNRDLNKELVSHGYNYHLLYGKKAKIMATLFLITHMKCYPKGTKYGLLKRYMLDGIAKAKEDEQ